MSNMYKYYQITHSNLHEPSPIHRTLTDEEIIQKYEIIVKNRPKPVKLKKSSLAICDYTNKIRIIFSKINEVKVLEGKLNVGLRIISNIEWNNAVERMNQLKIDIEREIMDISENMKELKQVLSKRQSKRLRLKRAKEKKQENLKSRENISKIIDENLKKMKAEIDKIKEDEKDKIEMDNVLSNVTRKKIEAKRCEQLLTNIAKLRQAREKSAIGRGQHVTSGKSFYSDIDNLLSLWNKRLQDYEEEESILKDKLKKNEKEALETDTKHICEVMFGGNFLPQRDFHGDVEAFLRVRSDWDQYLAEEGSPLPIGWIIPDNSKLPYSN